MKKRMILLLLLAVLLCGCDAEVNIKISGTRLHENISVNYYIIYCSYSFVITFILL